MAPIELVVVLADMALSESQEIVETIQAIAGVEIVMEAH